MGGLPEKGSAGQGCLEAACCLLADTLRKLVASFAVSFLEKVWTPYREFSPRDLFHMYLPVNYRRRTNKSINFCPEHPSHWVEKPF